jgi:hypothetical protein
MGRWAAAHPLRRAGLTPIETNLDKHLALVGLKDVRVLPMSAGVPTSS